jgi:hypothetical protein
MILSSPGGNIILARRGKMQQETGITFTSYPAVSVEDFDRFARSG